MTTTIIVDDAKSRLSSSKVSLWLNVILLVLLGISWITRPVIPEPQVVERLETIVEIDTVFVDRTLREVSLITDTVYVTQVVKDSTSSLPGLPPLRTYYQSFSDSLITGRLTALVRGELLEQKFFYNSKLPQYIDRTVTNTEFITERIIVRQSFLQAGLEVGIVAAGLQVNPMIGFTHHSGYSVFYRYSPWENGGHSIGVMSPIRIPWLNL